MAIKISNLPRQILPNVSRGDLLPVTDVETSTTKSLTTGDLADFLAGQIPSGYWGSVGAVGPIGNAGYNGSVGPVGPIGPLGPTGPAGTVVYDGGTPSTDFTVGVNINCGGVI